MLNKKFFGSKPIKYSMDYRNILFKDMLDIDSDFKQAFPGAHFVPARRPFVGDFNTIKILSVQFSRVGKTTLKRFPNLQWVQTRSHRTTHINYQECQGRRIGIVAANPHTDPCAHWIVEKAKMMEGPYGFLGWGRIAQTVANIMSISDPFIWNTTTTTTKQMEFFQKVGTCIVTVPLLEKTKGMVNTEFISRFHCTEVGVIGLSQMDVFDLGDRRGVILDREFKAWQYPTTERKDIKIIKQQIDLLKHNQKEKM